MIEWVVLVLFLGAPTGMQDMYLFTDPSFTTIEECNQSMLEPESINTLKFLFICTTNHLFLNSL